MSNSRAIVYLIVGIVVVAALNLFLDIRSVDNGLISLSDALIPLADDYNEIEISRAGTSVHLVEKEGKWLNMSPAVGNADEREIAKLIDALTITNYSVSLSDAELLRLGRERSDFNLDKPLITLKISGDDSSHKLDFGSLTPTGDGVYVAVDEIPKVFVAPLSLWEIVDRPSKAFRDKRIVVEEKENIRAIDIKKGLEPYLSLSRVGTGHWSLPGGQRASLRWVGELLTSLTDLEAVDYIWPNDVADASRDIPATVLASYELDDDHAIKITIGSNDGRERRFLIGKKAAEGDSVYALIDLGRTIVKIPSSLREKLNLEIDKIVDNRAFPFEQSRITTVSFKDSDTTYSLELDSNSVWRLKSPINAAADPENVKKLLGYLTSVMIDRAFDETELRVKVAVNGEIEEVPRFELFSVVEPRSLRSKRIAEFPLSSIKRVVTSGFVSPIVSSVVYDTSRDAWSVEAVNSNSKVNLEALKSLLSALASLDALEIVTLKSPASEFKAFGFDNPYLVVSIDHFSDEPRSNLLIGAAAPGGRYAMIGASDAIFILSDADISRLKYDIISVN